MSIGLRSVDARTVFAFIAVVSLQQAAIWNHTAWADEIQAAILARDSNSLSEWYWNFRYEGHPPLWHLYLKGWLLAGVDPFAALKAAASSLSLIVMGLIYFASPFTFSLKLLVSLSEPVLFHFGVISRSYTLGIALLFTAAALWRARSGWLVIPTLPWVSAQFIFIAAAFVVVRAREGLRWRACALLAVIGAVGSALYSKPANDYGFAGPEPLPGIIEGLLLASLHVSQVTSSSFFLELALPHISLAPLICAAITISFALAALVWTLLRADALWLCIAGGFIGFTLAISLFKYPLSYRHYALIVPLLIAAWWIAWPRLNGWPRASFLWLSALACAGFVQTSLDLRFPHSNSIALGEWIRENRKQDALIIGSPLLVSMELAPHVASSYKLGSGCLQTFAIFRAPDVDLVRDEPYEGDRIKILSPEDVSVALKSAAARAGGSAILVADIAWSRVLFDLGDPSIRLLAMLDRTRDRKHARFIFEVRALPVDGSALSRCSTRPVSG